MDVTDGIDRFYDFADKVVDTLDKAFGKIKNAEDKAPSKVAAPVGRPTSKALAPVRYRVIESIDAETGVVLFVVTSGAQRCECTTKELAEKIRQMLEAAPV